MNLPTRICNADQQRVPKDMMVRLALPPLSRHTRPVALRDSVAALDKKEGSYNILCAARIATKCVPRQNAHN